jgi:TonB family protein
LLVQPFLSAPSDEATRGVFLKNFLDGVIEGGGMKLESEKTISFEGHSGREYKMRADFGMGVGRAYFIGSNLYLMLGIVFKNQERSAEISRFFDSFRLTKNPDPAPATGAVIPGSAPWREVSEPGHGFKVSLPGEPKKESSYSNGVMAYLLISAGDGITCMVSRMRFPVDPGSQPQIDRFYKSFIDGFAKSGKFEITGEANIVFNDRKGREYTLKRGEFTGVLKVIIDGRDAYAISAVRLLPDVDPKSISGFFDSFKLIEKLPKDEFAEPPPPPPPAPLQPPKDAIFVSGGVLQASGIKKVEPVYPPIARAAKAEGEVRIQVIVSEEGKVIEAATIDGHPLLRDAALQAARQWEFIPKELSGKSVKVVGVLTFHFTRK